MQQATTTQSEKIGNIHDAEYSEFLKRLSAHFMASIEDGAAPLFTTDADGLWDAYLAAFTPEERPFHNCNACRHFIERFGALVVLRDGMPATPLWNMTEVPDTYRPSFKAVAKIVQRAKVTGVFLSSEPVWGHPETGKWRHFALWPRDVMLVKRARMTAGQVMAEKREEHGMVSRALAEFPKPLVEQAVAILKTDALYRSEKVLGQGEWLLKLHETIAATPGRRQNVIWSAVALAPSGFCHPRSSMIGTLLEDLERGLPFDDVARKFKDKMHPLQYQRPQAAPSAGNIAQAEKLVKELGIERSLDRRFARLEDITEALWRPKGEPAAPSGGMFAHLKPKDASGPQPAVASRQKITFDKFRRTVLDGAIAIDLLVPSHGNFCGLVTAEHADAPPILQWDLAERRNPVSWYLYHGGSPASRWGLSGGTWRKVDVVCLQPSMWNGGFEHQGEGVVFIVNGAKDSMNTSLALFPEILKGELREVRSVIEAHSRTRKLGGQEAATACGLIMQKSSQASIVVRVKTSATLSAEYEIDRVD